MWRKRRGWILRRWRGRGGCERGFWLGCSDTQEDTMHSGVRERDRGFHRSVTAYNTMHTPGYAFESLLFASY
jgi:hypothetical protein